MSALTPRQAALTVPIKIAAPLVGQHVKTAYEHIAAGSFPVPVLHLGSRIVVPKARLADYFGVTLDELERRIAAMSE